MTDSDRFLRTWKELWTVPKLWAAVHEAGPALDEYARANAVLETRLKHMSSLQVFTEQLTSGRFKAAEELLKSPEFLEQSETSSLKRRLDLLRSEAVHMLEGRIFVIEQRLSRVKLVSAVSQPLEKVRQGILSSSEEYLQYARQLILARADEANDLLASVEEEILKVENGIRAEIQLQLSSKLSSASDETKAKQWQASIEALLAEGDWSAAERWVRSGITTESMSPLTSRRLAWPYSNTQTALAWFKGDQREAPPSTFQREWGISEDDDIGKALLRALDSLETTEKAVTSAEVGGFLDALEGALEHKVTAGARKIEQVPFLSAEIAGMALQGRLSGLRAPGFYALAGTADKEDIPFIVTKAIVAPDIAQTNDEDEPESGPMGSTAGSDPFVIVYGPLPADRPADSMLQLSPGDLFRILGDTTSRRTNVLRIFGAKVPLRLALPRPIPEPQGNFVIGREELLESCRNSAEPVLIVGPTGSGRSAVLRALQKEPDGPGFAVHDLDSKDLRDLQELEKDFPSHSPDRRQIAAVSNEFVWTHARALPQCRIERLRSLIWKDSYCIVTAILDPLEVEFAETSIFDRFIYETGGHPAMIHLLLWHIFQKLEAVPRKRSAIITKEIVDAAMAEEGYRAEARRILLEFLNHWPALQVVLAAVLIQQTTDAAYREVTIGKVIAWPEMVDLRLSEDQARLALDRLAESGFLVEHKTGYWQLVQTGIGGLLLDLIGDPHTYLENSAQRCSKLADGTLLNL
jgi:hypothetical protein